MRYNTLGKTNLLVSALGFGTMRLPLEYISGNLDEGQAVDLIQYAFTKGINYIDTAFTYHNGKSEEIVGRAIKGIKRSDIIISTKCPIWEIQEPDDFDRILEFQLRRINTNYIDCYLFHALGTERWEKVQRLGLLKKMERAKAKGLIRYIGFSFHDDYSTLKGIIEGYDSWDICQLQYNYVDVNKQAGTEGIRLVKENNLGLVIMEPLHGGRLVKPPLQVCNVLSNTNTPIKWAFDFLYDQESIDLVLSGMSTRQQIDDNVEYANNSYPNMLTDTDRIMFQEAKRVYDSMSMVLCTSCRYCLPCSTGIDIPAIMRTYNRSGSTNYRNAKIEYDQLDPNANRCIHCRLCEGRCPQKIEISNIMTIVKETFQVPMPKLDEEALKIKWPARYKQMFADK